MALAQPLQHEQVSVMFKFLMRLMLAVAVTCAFTANAARAQYVLGIGDIVSFNVIGAPELGRNARVDMDGNIVLPLIGEVPAAGASVPDLRARVSAQLLGKSYVVGDHDSSESWRTLREGQIVIDIHEYRPVSILGDVFQPGSIQFRAGLSVRQALAEVGGLRAVRVDPERMELLAVELRAEQNALEHQIATLAPVVERLLSEQRMIAEGAVMEPANPEANVAELSASPAGTSAAQDLLHRQMDSRLAAWKHDVVSAEEAAAMLRQRLAILVERRDHEEETREHYADEYSRVEDLAARGIVARSALTDARRDLAFASTRALETGAEVARVEREVGEIQSELQGYWREAELDVLADLEQRSQQLETLRASLRSVEERLVALEGVGTMGEGAAAQVTVTLFRKTESGLSASVVDMGAALHPGDVLEVEVLRSRHSGL
jgi:polysaccharide biosynthesis/export protein